MPTLRSRIHPGLYLGLVLLAANSRARAETQTENIVAEQRTYAYLQVADSAAQDFLPAGWTVNPPAAGAPKGANLFVVFVDRKLALTPDGKPLQAGFNRLMVVLVPGKNTATGEAAGVVVGGFSADPQGAPGAYKAYAAGTVNVNRVEHGTGNLASSVEENWDAKGPDGTIVEFRLAFTRGVPTPNSFEQHVFSGIDPSFYRIYRGEQIVDVVRSVTTDVNRARLATLKVSGASKLAKAINGSEKIVAITSLPFYRRQTFLP